MKSNIVEATHTTEKVKNIMPGAHRITTPGPALRSNTTPKPSALERCRRGSMFWTWRVVPGEERLDWPRQSANKGKWMPWISDAMLAQVNAKLEKLGLSHRVDLKQGNARELPYLDGTFDLVYNGYMFDLIPLDGFLPILKEMPECSNPVENWSW